MTHELPQETSAWWTESKRIKEQYPTKRMPKDFYTSCYVMNHLAESINNKLQSIKVSNPELAKAFQADMDLALKLLKWG